MTIRLPGQPAGPWTRPKPIDPLYQQLVERARASAARELIQPQPATSGDQGDQESDQRI